MFSIFIQGQQNINFETQTLKIQTLRPLLEIQHKFRNSLNIHVQRIWAGVIKLKCVQVYVY